MVVVGSCCHVKNSELSAEETSDGAGTASTYFSGPRSSQEASPAIVAPINVRRDNRSIGSESQTGSNRVMVSAGGSFDRSDKIVGQLRRVSK